MRHVTPVKYPGEREPHILELVSRPVNPISQPAKVVGNVMECWCTHHRQICKQLRLGYVVVRIVNQVGPGSQSSDEITNTIDVHSQKGHHGTLWAP